MSKIKKLLAEFKAFISRGSVVDMAVAVVIGAAFTAIVTALTNGILMPLVNWAVRTATGGNGLEGMRTILGKAVMTTDAEGQAIIDWANTLYIDWGTFINKVVDFLIVAAVLFVIVKIFMSLRNANEHLTGKQAKRIRKYTRQYKKQGLTYSESYAKAKAQVAEEDAPAPAAPSAPTTEELLTQIRDLLAAQNNVNGNETK